MTQTTHAENNSNLLGSTLQKAVKFVGFILIMMALVNVSTSKLAELKNNYQDNLNPAITADQRIKELQCLTRNIYWEAASEPFEGKVAVAQVTMNRLESGRFADSVCGVVYQKNVVYEKVICQFSWYCEDTYKMRPVYPRMWKESEEVAKRVLLENFRLPSMKEALYYHADYVNPNWKKQKIDQIGRHIFYKDRS